MIRFMPTGENSLSYQTDERLKGYLDTNQLHREQMCLAVLAIDKRFSNVRPRHPRGGPDGGRDIDATFNGGQSTFGAVGFVNQANDSVEHKRQIGKKFREDVVACLDAEKRPEVFLFFTNVNLSLGEKDELIAYAKSKGFAYVEIFDRERIRLSLDNPDGLSIRYQYLQIPLSDAEQATFFARWGEDIQAFISDRFSRLESRLNRIQFLQEANSVLRRLTVVFDLDRRYKGIEIGHFRAFSDFFLKEPKHEIMSVLFGATDNPDRLRAANVDQLSSSQSGIHVGICGAQWEDKLSKGKDRGRKRQRSEPTRTSDSIGRDQLIRLHIEYSQDAFIRLQPSLLLQDINESMFIFFISEKLADKIKAIHVYANEYKLQEINFNEFTIDRTGFDPKIPLLFSNAELADPWVRIRPINSSSFHVHFSEQTPKRFFDATETIDSSKK
jgi:hypothetical protein